MRLLEASVFVEAPAEVRDLLLKSDVLPINDVFYKHWERQDKILLFYGSYGSGKSIYIADKWIHKARYQKYFRGYFGRKVLEDVRGTVHKTIIDRIRELYLDHLFEFSDKPNGSMRIVCKETGNEMLPFGASNAQSLKSIKDPTDFFCEEMDQFSFEDFGFIYSRLRTEKAITQFWGAFNTERIYQSHWIRKVFFDGEYADQSFKLLANYTDNYFINQEEYYKKLLLIANGNVAVLNAIARGEWGMVRSGNEFWKQFDETRHVKPVQPDLTTTIHVSLDENVTPYVTVSLWQIVAKNLRQIHEIPCKTPNNNAPKAAHKLADYLDSINYTDVVFIYGDPSASARSTIDPDSASFYDKFISILRGRGYKVINRVARSAPQIALSAAFINDIYQNEYNGYSITISDRCFTSIEDYMLVKEDADGKMLKPKVKDKETQVTYEQFGHFSDAKRYFITKILESEFNNYKSKSKRMRSVAA